MLFVVSMHRSGSSLLSGLLSKSGLNVGAVSELIPASRYNMKGYWERGDVVQANEDLLTDGIFNSSYPDYSDPIKLTEKKRRAVSRVAERLREDGVNIVKDPRLCLTLPIWLEEFPDAKIVLLFRDPLQVAKSMEQRQRCPILLGLALWEYYNLQLLKSLGDSHHLVVSFTEVIAGRVAVNDIYKWYLGKSPDRDDLEDIFDSKLIHNKDSANDSGLLSNSQSQLFKSFLEKKVITSVQFSDSLLATFRLTHSFVELGFDTRHGRLIDRQVKQRVVELESGINFLQRERESLKQAISSNKESHENKLLVVESKLLVVESKLKHAIDNLDLVQSDNHSLSIEHQELKLNQRENRRRLNLHRARDKRLAFRLAVQLDRVLTSAMISPFVRGCSAVKSGVKQLNSLALSFIRSANQQGVKSASSNAFRIIKSAELISVRPLWRSENIEAQGQLLRLSGLARKSQHSFTKRQSEFLAALFDHDFYIGVAELRTGVTADDCFQHFLDVGIDKGYAPGPLFSKEYVVRNLRESSANIDVVLKAWLTSGISEDLVPTPIFSYLYYCEQESIDLGLGRLNAFYHFLSTGLRRNRPPNQLFEPGWYRSHHQLAASDSPYIYHYLTTGYKKAWRPSKLFSAFSRSQCAEMSVSPLEFVIDRTRWNEISESLNSDEAYCKLIDKVAKLEPKIHEPDGVKRINVPPYNSPLFPAVRELRLSLAESSYDTIVLIPHCRVGGAALVAGYFCRGLISAFSSERVLLVRTDNDDFMRPDWFPHEVEVCNLLDFGPDLPDVFRKKLLLDLLIGLKPRRIVNIHSRLGWLVFTEFGDRLKEWSILYGYSFCYDVDALGRKVGYPIKFVPKAIGHLKTLFVDNTFLKQDLVRANAWSDHFAEKIRVLRSPADESQYESHGGYVWQPPIGEKKTERPKVYWAGRFDRQKRFDLVIEIAKGNPQWDFHIWGKAMLNEAFDPEDVPLNMKLHGLFDNLDEIDLAECSCWLYTSQWDGVPTLLIELAVRGVPVVASQVWGTNDIINDETAWPVKEVTKLKQYEKGLSVLISDQKEAYRRGQGFRNLVQKQYNYDTYSSSVRESLAGDEWRQDE